LLKDVLAKALQKGGEARPINQNSAPLSSASALKQDSTAAQSVRPEPTPAPRSETPSSTPSKPREIPEDVLKQILE
jgi:hypothetical protein